MKVFVTGGTGFVGSYVLHALREAGHNIVALTRPGSESKLPDDLNVTIAQGNVESPGGWRSALAGCDALINLIGIIREFPAKGVTFKKLHYEATLTLLNEAKKTGINHFVQMSANGADPDGVSEYQTTKQRAEEAIKTAGIDYTIFRPSVIFGDAGAQPEMTSELAKILNQTPFIPIFGDGLYQLQPIAAQDVARCFAGALTTHMARNRTFHLGGPDKLTYRDLFLTIARSIGHGYKPVLPIPLILIRPIASALGRFAFFPLTRDQLEMLLCGNLCPEEEYRTLFGVDPLTFTEENLGYLKH